MKFQNNGEDVQVRVDEKNGYAWILLYKGDTIDLPEKDGIRHGFTVLGTVKQTVKTTEGQIGNKKVETKQIEHDSYVEVLKDGIQAERDGVTYTPDDLFFKELTKIKGIGNKTAKDIVDWGTKEKLIEVIAMKGTIPFRDDVELKLRQRYG